MTPTKESLAATIAPGDFREVLGFFASGVTVITALSADAGAVGVTVSAFAALSLEPPMVLVCLGRDTADLDAYTEGDHFAVNVLARDQRHLSDLFASRRGDKFSGLDYQTWGSGCPILGGCLANLECARTRVFLGGDHVIVTGQVERVRRANGDAGPLLHFRGAYAALGGNV